MIYTTLDKNRDGFITSNEFGNSSIFLKRKSYDFNQWIDCELREEKLQNSFEITNIQNS